MHYYIRVATANIEPMTQPNSESIPNSDPQNAPGFNTQSQMGLPEVLQMCCLSRRSGQITFRSGESYGFIFIQHGNVLHAMCGSTDGEEAVYTMLTWPGGGFTLNEDILPHKKTIHLTWEQLLFEGARRADEGNAGPRHTTSLPVTTAEPQTNRTQESQPKLTITRPDMPPSTYELVHEYTHVGRTAGNEIPLAYPSISSRHCIFILSGPDIVVRDLNSSNGTMVNGEAVNEAVLRPGDTIQIGVVVLKFEAGIKRPKLQVPSAAAAAAASKPLENKESSVRAITHDTVKLPSSRKNRGEGGVADDSAFVKGVSAISYENLAKPETQSEGPNWTLIMLVVGVAGALIIGYFVILR